MFIFLSKEKKEMTSPLIIALDLGPKEAINLMKKKGYSQLPLTKSKALIGILHEKNILHYLFSSPN